MKDLVNILTEFLNKSDFLFEAQECWKANWTRILTMKPSMDPWTFWRPIGPVVESFFTIRND